MLFLKNNKFNFKIAVGSLVLLSAVIFFVPLISSAQLLVPQINGLTTADIKTVAGSIIQVFLGLLGLIALVIVLYAGFRWMTSGGNEEKIAQAKKILMAGVIGLIIILTSYIIVSFILEEVQNAINEGQEQPVEGPGFGDGLGGGALGGGVIEYHYPQRDAHNIPRNTLIMMTFKVKVATTSIISGDFGIGTPGENLCFNYTANNTNGNECGLLSDKVTIKDNGNSIASDKVVVVLQADGKNVLFRPIDILGSSEESTYTRVVLSSNMISAEGDDLFGMNGYNWRFEVSTFSDETPPTVDFVWPEGGATNVFRNAIIQMNFSEPINILSVNQDNIISTTSTIIGENLTGSLKISNQYRTVEFFSNMECGPGIEKNSCGEDVFCLPGLDDIKTTIHSGDSTNPLDGISDAAGNMFDGNFNGIEDGFILDDYEWTFATNDELYLDPPQIVSVNPANDQENVQLIPDPRVNVLFTLTPGVDGNISPSSLTTDVFYIYDNNTCVDIGEGEVSIEEGDKDNIVERDYPSQNDNCFPAYSVYMSEDNLKCNIKIYSNLENFTFYRPRIISELKDSYGNCFNPSEDQDGHSGQQ